MQCALIINKKYYHVVPGMINDRQFIQEYHQQQQKKTIIISRRSYFESKLCRFRFKCMQ